MKIETVLAQIFSEIDRAEKLHPDWPTDPIHQAAIVSEESGELLQASLNRDEQKGNEASNDHRSDAHRRDGAPFSEKH